MPSEGGPSPGRRGHLVPWEPPGPTEASRGLAWALTEHCCVGPTSWIPSQAGCGLNGPDYQITASLMVEITCKYARRPS